MTSQEIKQQKIEEIKEVVDNLTRYCGGEQKHITDIRARGLMMLQTLNSIEEHRWLDLADQTAISIVTKVKKERSNV